MAKVNLMRPEVGRVSAAFLPKFSFGRFPKLLLMLSAICFLGGLLVMAHTMFQRKNLFYLSSEYHAAEKLKKEIGLLQQEKDKLLKEMGLLDAYLTRDVAWSVKLAALRQLLPNEVWLKKLSYEKRLGKEKDFSLVLSGSLVPKSDSVSIATLSHFVDQLQENKDFFAGFGKPELSDLRSETRNNAEVMSFVIEIPIMSKDVRPTDEAVNK